MVASGAVMGRSHPPTPDDTGFRTCRDRAGPATQEFRLRTGGPAVPWAHRDTGLSLSPIPPGHATSGPWNRTPCILCGPGPRDPSSPSRYNYRVHTPNRSLPEASRGALSCGSGGGGRVCNGHNNHCAPARVGVAGSRRASPRGARGFAYLTGAKAQVRVLTPWLGRGNSGAETFRSAHRVFQ